MSGQLEQYRRDEEIAQGISQSERKQRLSVVDDQGQPVVSKKPRKPSLTPCGYLFIP